MSSRIQLADLVVAELQAHAWSQEIRCVGRKWIPRFDVKASVLRQVTVCPEQVLQPAPPGRGGSPVTEDVSCQIVLQHKLESEDNAEIDPLDKLLLEFGDHFRVSARTLNPPDASDRTYQYLQAESLIGEEHIAQKRVFTGILTLTYRLTRN